MRAAENERVDVGGGKRPKVFLDDDAGRGMVDPAFLDKWNEQRSGTRGDDGVGTQRANRLFVGSGFDRTGGAHDSDPIGRGRRDRGPRSRIHNANHGQ